MVVVGGCSGGASSNSSATTSANQPRPAEVIVHLKPGTTAGEASRLPNRLITQPGDITGSDWNAQVPGVVVVDLGPSETVAQIDLLLTTIKTMSHVQDVGVQFG